MDRVPNTGKKIGANDFRSQDETTILSNSVDIVKDFEISGWKVLPKQNRFQNGPREILISPKSMDVLMALATADGETLSKDDLINIAWHGLAVADDSVHRAISKLRKALSEDEQLNDLVITVPRRGYRLNTALVKTLGAQEEAFGNGASSGVTAWRIPSALAIPIAFVVIAGVFFAMTALRDRGSITSSGTDTYRLVPITKFLGQERGATFAPSSDEVVFAWSGEKGDQWDLYRLFIGSWDPQPLTNDASFEFNPAWSPIGEHVAFVHITKEMCSLTIMSMVSAERTPLHACSIGSDVDVAWSPNGATLFFTERVGRDGPIAVYAMDVAERTARQVTFPPTDNWGDSIPAVSADGRVLAFARTHDIGVTDLFTIDLTSGKERQITHDKLKIHGLAWSGQDELTFSSNRGGGFGLWRVNTDGREPRAITDAGSNADSVAISADGRRLIFEKETTHANLRQIGLSSTSGQVDLSLSPSTGWEWHPDVSPGSGRVAFISDRSGAPELWQADSAGAAPRQMTQFGGPYLTSPQWAPQGNSIAVAAPVNGNFDIYLVDVASSAQVRLTEHRSSDRTPAFGRTGEDVYFSSNRTGRWEIWRRLLAAGSPEQITNDGGFRPVISDDGSFLYFTKREESGIWRLSLAGSNEQPVQIVQDLSPIDWSNWTLHEEWLYYIVRDQNFDAQLSVHNTRSGKTIVLRTLPAITHHSGLTITPDGAGLIYSRHESVETDLFMLEEIADSDKRDRAVLSYRTTNR